MEISDKLAEELQDLIGLLAQHNDVRNTNIEGRLEKFNTNFENFKAEMRQESDKRWSYTQWILGSVLVAILAAFVGGGLTVGDTVYNRMYEFSKQLSDVQHHLERSVTKEELKECKNELLGLVIRSRGVGDENSNSRKR